MVEWFHELAKSRVESGWSCANGVAFPKLHAYTLFFLS